MSAHIEGCYGSGRVAGDELHLHVEAAEEVLVPGLESGAGVAVEGEGEELAVVEDFGTAVAPSDVHVLVEICSQRSDKARYEEKQRKKKERECGHGNYETIRIRGVQVQLFTLLENTALTRSELY